MNRYLNFIKKIIIFLLLFPFGIGNLVNNYEYNIGNILYMIIWLPIERNINYILIFLPIILSIIFVFIFFPKQRYSPYFLSLLFSTVILIPCIYKEYTLFLTEQGLNGISYPDSFKILGIFIEFLYIGIHIFSILFSINLYKIS